MSELLEKRYIGLIVILFLFSWGYLFDIFAITRYPIHVWGLTPLTLTLSYVCASLEMTIIITFSSTIIRLMKTLYTAKT